MNVEARLSRLDLSDEEVRKDCEHELRRAQGVGLERGLTAWAEKWGDAVVAAFHAEDSAPWN